MKKLLLLCAILFPLYGYANNCNLHDFKWECDLSVKAKRTKSHPHIIYCGDTYVYLSNRSKRVFDRYINANVNMVLKVDGQYIDSPCFY